MGRMIPKPHDLAKGEIYVPMAYVWICIMSTQIMSNVCDRAERGICNKKSSFKRRDG